MQNQISFENNKAEIDNEVQSLKGEEDGVIKLTNQSENFNL